MAAIAIFPCTIYASLHGSPPRHDTKQTNGESDATIRPLGLVMVFHANLPMLQKACPKLHKNAQWNDNFFSEHLKSGKLVYIYIYITFTKTNKKK